MRQRGRRTGGRHTQREEPGTKTTAAEGSVAERQSARGGKTTRREVGGQIMHRGGQIRIMVWTRKAEEDQDDET